MVPTVGRRGVAEGDRRGDASGAKGYRGDRGIVNAVVGWWFSVGGIAVGGGRWDVTAHGFTANFPPPTPHVLSDHPRPLPLHRGLDFLDAHHARVAWRGHRERAVRSAVFHGGLRAFPLEECVREPGGEA